MNNLIEIKKIPRLRFPGFSGKWKKKNLGEIAEVTSSKRVYLSDYVREGIPFFRGKEISELKKGIKNSEVLYIKKSKFIEFKNKFGAPKKGDILITSVGTLGNIYKVNIGYDFYFKDGNLIWLRNLRVNSDFLEISLDFNRKNLLKGVIGSTQKALTIDGIRKIKINLPSLPEQQKIADFLGSVDEWILNLRAQREFLESYKKGIMQRIFSREVRFKDKNGKDFPEPSFAKATAGNWEEKRLGEILEIGNGKNYKHLKVGDVPVFGTGGYMLSVDKALYDGESVLIGRKGTINKPFYYNGKFWTVDTLFYTYNFKNVIPKFISLIFQQINWLKYNEASGVPSLSKATIEKIKVKIPSILEQQKISNFLTSIDNLINLKQQQLAGAEQWKKGLMQGLFV